MIILISVWNYRTRHLFAIIPCARAGARKSVLTRGPRFGHGCGKTTNEQSKYAIRFIYLKLFSINM